MEVVKAVAFKHNTDVRQLLEAFNRMINECMEYALKSGFSSPIKLEKAKYDRFKLKYGFATHYCISAFRMACSAIKYWRRLMRKNRADVNKPPTFKALVMRLQRELMRFKGESVTITTKPYHHMEIPLIVGLYQRAIHRSMESRQTQGWRDNASIR